MSDGRFEGKAILVSGVGPGLGREVARLALDWGARTVLGDVNGPRVQAIASELDDGSRTVAIEADVRSRSACEHLVDTARSAYGRLDGLVHVAAHDSAVGGLLDGDLDDWSMAAEVNVKGTLQLTKAAVPLMRDGGGGSIVIVGSIAAAGPVKEVIQLAYGMSKAALATGAYYLSRELGPLGIRVNTVAPGWKWGPRLEGGLGHLAARVGHPVDAMLEEIQSQISLRQFATDQDVANSIGFLLSDEASRITGQTIYVDGGIGH